MRISSTPFHVAYAAAAAGGRRLIDALSAVSTLLGVKIVGAFVYGAPHRSAWSNNRPSCLFLVSSRSGTVSDFLCPLASGSACPLPWFS